MNVADDAQQAAKGRFLDRRTPPNIFTLILLSGVAALCVNVFLPDLPKMTAHFQADYALMQLSFAVYLAMSAVIQLFIGVISDKFGRRPVVLAGVAIFLHGSAPLRSNRHLRRRSVLTGWRRQRAPRTEALKE